MGVRALISQLKLAKGGLKSMIKEIKKGDRFVCEKSCNHFYTKGTAYTSDKDGCITDNNGNKAHSWDDIKRLNKRFKLISTKTQAGLDTPASCMPNDDQQVKNKINRKPKFKDLKELLKAYDFELSNIEVVGDHSGTKIVFNDVDLAKNKKGNYKAEEKLLKDAKTFQNYSKEYLDNAQELQAFCDAQSSQQGYTKAEQQFEEVITETLKQCQDTMLIKGREYRRNNNPFHNFDKGVEISGQIREDVIWGFALKHFISIQDIRSDLRDGKLPSEELLNEKYGDMINYLLIEKASIVAKIKGEQ